MASDVLGPNSAFTRNNKDIINYADHLYENHILDDVEPQYENSDIIRKILQKSNGFSKSLVAIHEEVLNTKAKEENIYENIGFIENVFNSLDNAKKVETTNKQTLPPSSDSRKEVVSTFNTIVNKEKGGDVKRAESRFTSTFTVTIGKPLTLELSEQPTNTKLLSIDIHNTPEEPEGEDSDDASFKSSYAKSLIDSLRKSSTSASAQTSPVGDSQSRLSSPSIIQEEIRPVVTFMQLNDKETSSIQNSSRNSPSRIMDYANPRALEHLEKRISSLTDNVLMKDKEMEKLRQEVVLLKLECNRVKAENRNLKVGLGNGMTHRTSSPFHVNGEIQPSSFSSISPDSDTWMLQQQILTLNAQLEKAELSRRAYEAATRQLVHFLQTINTTLSTVAGPDSKIESPFTPQNTSELLTNLELSLLHNRIRSNLSPRLKLNGSFSDSTKDGSFTAGRSEFSPLRSGGDRLSKQRQETRSPIPKENRLSTGSGAPHSLSSSSSQDSTKQTKELCEKSSLSKDSGSDAKERKAAKRGSPQRRLSISQKVWNATKKPLTRSGSVSNLPSEAPSIPRVSRALSTHCVATTKIDTFPHSPDIDAGTSDTGSANSNRMLSAKAKDFFSSLKNIFRNDGDRAAGATHAHADASTNIKKKLALPSLHRSNKVRVSATDSTPPLSLPPASSQQTHLKKRQSLLKTHSMPRVTPSGDTELPSPPYPNSVFYVSCFADGVDDDTSGGDDQEQQRYTPPPPESTIEEGRRRPPSNSTSLTQASPPAVEEEMSGPQELSVALSVQDTLQDNPTSTTSSSADAETQEKTPSGAHFSRLVTGGGFSTAVECQSDGEDDTRGVYNGDGSTRCVQSLSTSSCSQTETNVRHRCTSFKDSTNGGISAWPLACTNQVSKHACQRTADEVSCAILRRRSDLDAIGLKRSMWKMARESHRVKGCKLVFV